MKCQVSFSTMSDLKALRQAVLTYDEESKRLRLEESKLRLAIHHNNHKLRSAKADLKKYPIDLYWSTESKVPLPLTAVNLILWYYIRMSNNRIKMISQLSVSFKLELDPVSYTVGAITMFCALMEGHKMAPLLKQSLDWFGSMGSTSNPKWKSEPIRGSTLKEALDQVPTLKFKVRTLKATVFGPDGLIVFKCAHSEKVSSLFRKRLQLFRQMRSISVFKDGLMIPYQATDMTQFFVFEGITKIRYSFLVNKQSWRLRVVDGH